MPSRFERLMSAGVLALLFLLANLTTKASADVSIRVLILAGDGDPVRRASVPVLRRILADTGRFDVRVCEATAGLTSRTLDGFDLVVDGGGGLSDAETAKSLERFVASGKGLLIAAGAFACPSPISDLQPIGLASGPLPPVGFLDVSIVRPEHPIVAGLKTEFRTADAVPSGAIPKAGSETLAVASNGGGVKTAVLATSTHGKGRVVSFALGHDASALNEPQTIALFARAGEWAATGAVQRADDLAHARPQNASIRALLITGGHFHDASFYSLFSDFKELPVETSAEAFKNDIRGKYDVVIMYDFTRDLDETGRKNLRDFVESGKGVVILHHALLNFQTWTWWSESVAGGRYRLQREGDAPSSSVKDDQQIYVTPTATHPVLEGVGPFHIQDEAYKNLYMSDRIKPLLTTDNPTSDVSLAWIGPCETSRVVAIQLGHGPTAFSHPSYRCLVLNAVRWAAGATR